MTETVEVNKDDKESVQYKQGSVHSTQHYQTLRSHTETKVTPVNFYQGEYSELVKDGYECPHLNYLGRDSEDVKLVDSVRKEDDNQPSPTVSDDRAKVDKKIIEISSKDQVAMELKRLVNKFTSLVCKIVSHLEEMIKTNKCQLIDIARHIKLLPWLSEEKELDKLIKVTTIDELFVEIEPYYCFLSNCELIESIVNTFLSESDLQNELAKYLEELEAFDKSAELQHIQTAIEEALIPNHEMTKTTCKVEIKLQRRCGRMTLDIFRKLINYLFPMMNNVYSHIYIKQGCIYVSFLVPHSQSQSLILTATEKTEIIYQVGIFKIIINDQPILMEEEDGTFSFEQSLLQAAQAGHNNDIIILLELGANVDYQNEDGQTALIFASQNAHYQIVELLLKENADPNLQNQEGWNALMFASQYGHYQVTQRLLKENVDPNFQTQEGLTALIFASGNGHYQVVELLLQKNADPNLQTQEGLTALIFASGNGHYQVVELLLKENADSNLQTQEGWTALIFASLNGHYQVVELLLKENADPNSQDHNGLTALMFAGLDGYYQIVEVLLKENANHTLQTQKGSTALIFASVNGHYHVVELLLKENADPNLQDQEGWTALIFASHIGHYQVVELLLKENANHNLQTEKGWTASTIASQNGHFEIVQLLEKYNDPSSSSCEVLDHSINQPIESTSSAILIHDQQTEEPIKQPQSIQTATEYVVEQNVLPHSTIHSSSLKQAFQYNLIKSIKQPFHTFKDTKKKELRDNKSNLEQPQLQHHSTLIQLPLHILRKKLKKTQRKHNVTTKNIVNK